MVATPRRLHRLPLKAHLAIHPHLLLLALNNSNKYLVAVDRRCLEDSRNKIACLAETITTSPRLGVEGDLEVVQLLLHQHLLRLEALHLVAIDELKAVFLMP